MEVKLEALAVSILAQSLNVRSRAKAYFASFTVLVTENVNIASTVKLLFYVSNYCTLTVIRLTDSSHSKELAEITFLVLATDGTREIRW